MARSIFIFFFSDTWIAACAALFLFFHAVPGAPFGRAPANFRRCLSAAKQATKRRNDLTQRAMTSECAI
jgi:hypothetical protein